MSKVKLAMLVVAALLIFFLAKTSITLFSILICVAVMMHKKYLGAVLGIDICLIFTLLAASAYGPSTGAIIGGVSYFLGMVISLEFGKSPMVTFYGTFFYAVLGVVFSIFPTSIVYSFSFVVITIVNVMFCIGAFFLGAPPAFLATYASTNMLANLVFIQIFGGLLKTIY